MKDDASVCTVDDTNTNVAFEKENYISKRTPQISKLPVGNSSKKSSGRKGTGSSHKRLPGSGIKKQPLTVLNKKQIEQK